jgi:plastocyanin
MRPAVAAVASVLAIFVLAGCSGGGGGTNPPVVTDTPSQPAASAGAPTTGCGPSSETAAVTVEIAGFEFGPAEATASVGDTVSWSNADAAPHTATLDDGGCETGNIPAGGAGGLVFNEAGTFAYHCAIHPTMTGSITISE